MWHRLPSGNYAELCYHLVIMLYYAFCVNYANYAKASDAQPNLGLPPDADGNGNYAFFDAANYALIQMTGGVTAISAV